MFGAAVARVFNLFTADVFNFLRILPAEVVALAVVREQPFSILAFYDMTKLVQEYQYANLPGVWLERPDTRHCGFCL